MTAFAHRRAGDLWVIGNDLFELAIALDGDHLPRLRGLTSRVRRSLEWTPGTSVAVGPVLEIDGRVHTPGSADLRFEEIAVDGDGPGLRLDYRLSGGLHVGYSLRPSPEKAAFRTWTILTNGSTGDLGGISRMDALNLRIGVSDAEPKVSYLTGWLDGPRLEAPGHHSVPFAYSSWIPRLLYGDGPHTFPPPPAGGWVSSALRLIQGERLTSLPLRSGKRSTYENHPWVCVLDPGQQAGFFAGFECGRWMRSTTGPTTRYRSLPVRTAMFTS